jgi:hypothetical protein
VCVEALPSLPPLIDHEGAGLAIDLGGFVVDVPGVVPVCAVTVAGLGAFPSPVCPLGERHALLTQTLQIVPTERPLARCSSMNARSTTTRVEMPSAVAAIVRDLLTDT